MKPSTRVAYALGELFLKYFQNEDTHPLDPMELRREVSQKSKLFELKHMADSAEVLTFLLAEVHKTALEETQEDTDCISCNERCPSHECFNLLCLEQVTCQCSQEILMRTWNYSTFSFPVHVDELLESAAKQFDDDLMKYVGKFELCYPKSVKKEMCTLDPSKCKAATCEYTLLTAPKVLFLTLVGKWESLHRKPKILKLLALFSTELPISALFHGSNTERYRLKAWIAFNFNHYVSYVRCSKSPNSQDPQNPQNLQEWVKYNDSTITSFPSFKDVIRELLECEFHPTLLCYELIGAEGSGPEIEIQESDWSALKDKTSSRLRGMDGGLGSADSVSLPGQGLWMCRSSGCFWCNDSNTDKCSKCGTSKNAKQDESGNKSLSIGSGMDVGKTYTLGSDLLRRERPKACDKCRRHVPNKGQCVCTRFLIPHKVAGLFICPKCRLIMEGESSLCENCGANLRLLRFYLNCAKCSKAIETKGYCKQCEIDVETSPCPHCSFNEVVCVPCKA